MSTLKISVDLAGIDQAIDGIAAHAEAAARPAAQAGAQVFYDEVRRRVPVSKKGHWFHGRSFKLNGQKYWFDSGSLKSAVYQVFSKDSSSAGLASYHVAWNHKKVPYGFMVEFGTRNTPAHPFLRPAAAKADDVASAMRNKFLAELQAKGVTK